MANNDSKKYKLGMIGLGTMGRNLLLNMAGTNKISVRGVCKLSMKFSILSKPSRL